MCVIFRSQFLIFLKIEKICHLGKNDQRLFSLTLLAGIPYNVLNYALLKCLVQLAIFRDKLVHLFNGINFNDN